MVHLQWERIASSERDAASPAGDMVSSEGDLLASSNFGICDTTRRAQTEGIDWKGFLVTELPLRFDYQCYSN
jgi:hypothetical protein